MTELSLEANYALVLGFPEADLKIFFFPATTRCELETFSRFDLGSLRISFTLSQTALTHFSRVMIFWRRIKNIIKEPNSEAVQLESSGKAAWIYVVK